MKRLLFYSAILRRKLSILKILKKLINSSMDSMSLSRIIIIIIHEYSPIIHFTLRSLLDTDISYTNRIKKMKREMQD